MDAKYDDGEAIPSSKLDPYPENGSISPEGFGQNLEYPEVEEIARMGREGNNGAIRASPLSGRSSYGDSFLDRNCSSVSSHDNAFNSYFHACAKQSS